MKKDITLTHDFEIPMRDGVVLRCDIYGPNDDAAYPVILLRFPYLKDSFPYQWGRLNPIPLAQAGYRVVVQDCRGTGHSQGKPDFDGEIQRTDGYDTIEFLAAQPWCDGNVGMYGLSYYGFTQLLAAEARPPHLKAIAPWQQSGLPKYSGGFTTGSLHLMWLLERARDRLYSPECTIPEPDRSRIRSQVEQYLGRFGEVVSFVPEGDNPAAKIEGLPFLRDYLRRVVECDDPEGPKREGRPIDFSKIDIPCFFLGGWYDETSKNGPIENWTAMASLPDGARRLRGCKMIMGPWNHGERIPDSVGWRSFGRQAVYPMGMDLTEHLIRFFDCHLKGVDNGLLQEPPVTYFSMGTNTWHQAQTWPIPGTQPLRLYLSGTGSAAAASDGSLAPQPGADGSESYDSDPTHPIPARVPGISAECQDQRLLESRPDVAVFTSDVLTGDLNVTGEIRAELYVSSDCPDTDVICKLTEVFPDGRSLNITDGAVRASYNNTYCRELLSPGEVRKLQVRMGNTGNVFRKGSRIRLLVMGSAFPKYDRNHHVSARVGTSAEMVVSHDTLFCGTSHPSFLELPVLPQ
ncbi:MAG: CocE/NonD family hydrolase [Firmicutes bacterium]|nr:CocE/NonD family hydrolase [Bacillota bacterium]